MVAQSIEARVSDFVEVVLEKMADESKVEALGMFADALRAKITEIESDRSMQIWRLQSFQGIDAETAAKIYDAGWRIR